MLPADAAEAQTCPGSLTAAPKGRVGRKRVLVPEPFSCSFVSPSVGHGCWVLGAGCCAGCWVLGAVLGAGCWVLGTRSRCCAGSGRRQVTTRTTQEAGSAAPRRLLHLFPSPPRSSSISHLPSPNSSVSPSHPSPISHFLPVEFPISPFPHFPIQPFTSHRFPFSRNKDSPSQFAIAPKSVHESRTLSERLPIRTAGQRNRCPLSPTFPLAARYS